MCNAIPSHGNPRSRRTFLKTSAGLSVAAAFAQTRATAAPLELSPLQDADKKLTPSMQIGILIGTFRRPTIEAAFDAVKASGLDCVQLSMDAAGLSPMPDQIAPELIDRIHRDAADRGISIASVQGTFNMSHPDPKAADAGLRQLRVLASACQRLGTSMIHICTGTRDRDNMWRRHADNNSPQAWRDMVSCISEAVNIAQQTEVVLAFEPEVNNVVDSALKARRLLDEIHSPHLKVTMDAANIFHTGELARMSEVLDQAFALLGKEIVLAHAKDLDRDGDAGHKAAGDGLLDYPRYLSLLIGYGFRGPLLLHGLTESQVPGCVAFFGSAGPGGCHACSSQERFAVVTSRSEAIPSEATRSQVDVDGTLSAGAGVNDGQPACFAAVAQRVVEFVGVQDRFAVGFQDENPAQPGSGGRTPDIHLGDLDGKFIVVKHQLSHGSPGRTRRTCARKDRFLRQRDCGC